GIRDGHVTGVQTCALPIFRASPPPGAPRLSFAWFVRGPRSRGAPGGGLARSSCPERGFVRRPSPSANATRRRGRDRVVHGGRRRSEERRVGKGCRSGWERG